MTGKNGDKSREVGQRHENRLRARLLGLEDPSNGLRLEGRSRLKAALHISNLYRKAKRQGYGREEINERIGRSLRGTASRSFRIERWSLPFAITKITDDVVDRYRNKSEPQKKASVYFRTTRILAELVGDDPQGRQLELLELTNLDSPSGEVALPDIDPSQKLADLLQRHAQHLANKLDLCSLIEKAARLQAGWDMHSGPVAKFIASSGRRYDARATAFALAATDDSVPPYPSIQIATIPFQVHEGPFRIGYKGMPHGTPIITEGCCTCSWHLYLTIAPSGEHQFGAFLARSAEMSLRLQPHENFPGFDGIFLGRIDNEEIEAVGAFYLHVEGLDIETTDGRSWVVEIASSASDEFTFEDTLDDMIVATGRTLPLFRNRIEQPSLGRKFQPVTAGAVQNWLLSKNTITLLYGETDVQIQVPGFDPQSLAAAPHTWNTGGSLGFALEVALHGSELDAAFQDWTAAYRQSLDDLYADWIVMAQSAEDQLRQRWKTESERP